MSASPPTQQTIDELRATLLKAHGATVGRDDPILMVYTIHRAGLEELSALLEKARADLAAAVEKSAASHSAEVRTALAEISEAVTADSLKQRLAAMQEAAVLADRTAAGMRKTLRRISILSVFNAFAVFVCVGVLALIIP